MYSPGKGNVVNENDCLVFLLLFSVGSFFSDAASASRVRDSVFFSGKSEAAPKIWATDSRHNQTN